ncbi:MAG: Crp/Fnr family transcriptional regulator, partial [Acidobacteria bacterium]
MGPLATVHRLYILGWSNAEAWKEAGQWSPPRLYPAGTELLREGMWAGAVYLIEQGLVKLSCSGPDHRPLILGLSAQGGLLGPNSALLQQPLAHTAEALTDCHASHMTAERFRYWVKTNPQFSWRFHQVQSSERQRLMMQRVAVKCLS